MIRRLIVGVVIAGAATTLSAQRGRGGAPLSPAGPRNGTLEHVTVNGRAADLYLPPSYASDAMRRFPVVYVLAERPSDNLKLPEAADRLSSSAGFSEPIVVFPDTSGSLADLEKFAGEELVAFVDGRYRTMPARISRGLAGYGLGGDAALRVGVSRPAVFSSLYLVSASLVDASVAMVDGNAASLQRYYGVAINVGAKDAALAMNRRLHDAMVRLRIPHYYEEYDGAYADRAAEQTATRVLPFFSRNLSAPANPTSPAVQ
jgi:enterochelin esterase-like enzyme